ncbi:MAG: pyridoxal phosphate-dependent aminotransferase [Acidimicrobiia bacterium]|nr:pyridoxal phosphate-dependent aminotransferase [Acidimicrobiia bacterium]
MSEISPRIAAIAPSATLAITSKAKALKAEGKPVIGFGAGEPDFPTPDHVVEAAAAAVRDPRHHKYSPAAGLPELRAAVAARMSEGGVPTEAGDVLITNGGKQAVYSAFATLMGPGDEVLLPAPYWVSYPEAINLAGATPVVVSTGIEAGFKVTPDQLEAHRTAATKALIFVSPSNPTGAVYSAEEVRAIGEWAAEHGVWVLTDEIYDHLVYGDATFTSMPAAVPEVRDRCVVLNGVAKTYAMTGWRVGWMAGPSAVIKAASNLQSHLCSNVANVSQMAALAAITGPTEPVERMHDAFDRRRLTMHRMLNEIPGVTCLEPQGAFYAFPSFAGAAGDRSTLDLAAEILEESLVALVPGEAFGAPGYMRLSYALGDEDLEEGLRRLAAHLA